MRRAFVVLGAVWACGGSTTLNGSGAGGAGAAGSVTTAGVGTTAQVGSGGQGGGNSGPCGVGYPPCTATDYCDTPDDQCGAPGQCRPRPEGCDADCPGVCGCDGEFYCNACNAQENGVDVGGDASCGDPAAYRATAWFGGLDHIIITRWNSDPGHEQCAILYMDAPTMSNFQIATPMSWGVSTILQYDSVAPCLEPAGAPGDTAYADTGTGVISWTVDQGMYFPCEIDISVVASFSGDGWIQPMVEFEALGIPVDGNGCM